MHSRYVHYPFCSPCIKYIFFREANNLAVAVPLLCNPDNLRRQCEWLVDGQIHKFINANLVDEIDIMQAVLQRTGLAGISDILQRGQVVNDVEFSLSGQTYMWVTVLRTADMIWNPTDSISFIRFAEEGIKGMSPHIIVHLSKRLVKLVKIRKRCK